MRSRPCIAIALLGVLAAASCAWASPADGPQTPRALGPVDDPVLPLKIPGYELRVLDRKKPVVLMVGGERVEGSLPIFIYFPTADRPALLAPLRRAYDGLLTLGRKPEWTGAELRQVLQDLDQALRLLELPSKSPSPAP